MEVNNLLATMSEIYLFLYEKVPGSNVIIRYIQNSYQNDPFRIVLELFLVIFAFKYLTSKTYSPDTQELSLTEKEIDELVGEWTPEPLVNQLPKKSRLQLENVPVIDGPAGPYVVLMDGKKYTNLASFDFLGISELESIHESAIKALRVYGVGACGPPGFYGTIDVHQDLERELASFIGTEEAIIYSQSFSALSSVIPAFAKRGDIVVCDEKINFALQKGVQISRSTVKYFKHNDMSSLEAVLKEICSKAAKLTRRFIVVEGIYQNTGNLCNLPKLLDLKRKYKFRLIVDESISFGSIGRNGSGVTNFFNVPAKDVDIIVGSMSNSLGSSGGFCAGSREVVDHQRLSGVAYCFSAALPALLAKCALVAIKEIRNKPELIGKLNERIQAFRSALGQQNNGWYFSGDVNSPVIHVGISKAGVDAESILNAIVLNARSCGLLITMSQYVASQETSRHPPTIRISLSSAHKLEDIKEAGDFLRKEIINALSK